MARARNIKPSFFTNEKLADLPFSTRLLFVGLWTMCDRLGRMEDRPKRIKMNLFPADRIDIEKGLKELAKAGFITRYVVDNEAFIEIPTFLKHQSPHVKEAASTIPAPDKHGASTVKESLNPESPFLNPESIKADASQAEAAVVSDPVERRIWRDGVEMLVQNGMTEANTRPLLGRLVKQYSKLLVAQAIAATQAENPADPKAFLIGVLKERSGENNRSKALIGKSDLPEPEINCRTCNDLKKVYEKPPDAEYDWQVTDRPCPDCVGVLEAVV